LKITVFFKLSAAVGCLHATGTTKWGRGGGTRFRVRLPIATDES